MEIWIGRDGERHGPYKEDDVRQWLRSGQVSREDLAWYEGLADWQPLSVLFPDEVRDTAATSGQPSISSASPLQPLPQTTTAALEDYAGFWKRFVAWVVDYLILLVPLTFIAITMDVVVAFEHLLAQLQSAVTPALAVAEYVRAVRPATMLSLLIGYFYYVLFECSKWQATPGKLAMSLRVSTIDGGRIGFGRSLARNAIRLLNVVTALIPLICYVIVAWTARKQGLHDMICGTLVLNGRASEFKPAAPSSGGNSFNA